MHLALGVAFPVPVADVLQMGKHAVDTVGTMDGFARSLATVCTLFHCIDTIDTLGLLLLISGFRVHLCLRHRRRQNAHIERFNRTFREDVLDAYLFRSLEEVRHTVETWIEECNAVRPHEALQGFAPYQFAAQYAGALLLPRGTRKGRLTEAGQNAQEALCRGADHQQAEGSASAVEAGQSRRLGVAGLECQ